MFIARFVLFCVDAVNDFSGKNCHYIAGAIAFYTLFSMFPLFLAIISVLGYVLPHPEAGQVKLAKDIAEVLPVSSGFVAEKMQEVVSARAIVGITSIFMLLWAATAVFGAIRKGVNAAWGIKKTRPFLKERLIDLALVLGASVLLLAVLFSGPTLSVLQEIVSVLAPESEFFGRFIWKLLAVLVYPRLAFVTFLSLYTLLPNTEVRLKDVWPVALLASLAFDAVNLAFAWYVNTYSTYNFVYGSVGTILALLTWVYLSAIIVLFGALTTSRYAEYAASIDSDKQSLKLLWTGFARVRLRIVESTTMG